MNAPPTNPSPFDFTAPNPNAELRRRRNQQVGWLMALLLLGILGYGVSQRDTGFTAAEATRLEKIEQALQDTKPIYGKRAENGQQSLNLNPGAARAKPSGDYQTEVAQTLLNWRNVTERKGAHPSDWRRLGIVQAIFGNTKALETFQKLPTLYALHQPALNVKPKTQKSKRRSKQDADEATDEAIIWKPKLPPAQELALWTAIYGANPMASRQVPALTAQVKQLGLGWFEPVALSDLYAKAGLRTEASHAEEAALTSVRYLVFFDKAETAVRTLSFPAVFFFFGWFLRRRGSVSPLSPAIIPYGERSVGNAPPLYNAPPPKIPPVFSYHARMVAFVTYMALPLVLFLPLLLFRDRIHALSDVAIGRLEALLEVGGSLLTAFIAIQILRRVDASDRREAEEDGLPFSLRDTLYRLGYRSRDVPGDIGAGLVGYPALFVPLIFAGLLSRWLFRHYETPPHPVLMSIAGLHTPFDRALLFLESAILPPLVEELMFRGLLYPALRERWGIAGGVALSAAIFALVHPTLPGGFLPLWTMGAIWAFTYERRGSLLPSILMHALNNGLLIALEMSALSN